MMKMNNYNDDTDGWFKHISLIVNAEIYEIQLDKSIMTGPILRCHCSNSFNRFQIIIILIVIVVASLQRDEWFALNHWFPFFSCHKEPIA